MNGDLVTIKVFSFHNTSYDTVKPPMRMHSHKTLELYYVQDGSVDISYLPHDSSEAITFTLYAKHFALFRPDITHSINSQNTRLNVYNLELTAKDNTKNLYNHLKNSSYVNLFPVARNLIDKWNDILIFTDNQNVAHILRQFKKPFLIDNENPYYEANLDIALKRLFLDILNCAPERLDLTGNIYIKKAVKIIDSTYNQQITTAQIASMTGISLTHLERAFKEQFRTTLKQYINTLRIERAKRLIIETNLPISQIILNSGFNTAQSFNTNFKKNTGQSPLNYRITELQKNIKYRNILYK